MANDVHLSRGRNMNTANRKEVNQPTHISRCAVRDVSLIKTLEANYGFDARVSGR
jgi:hypothetical protein